MKPVKKVTATEQIMQQIAELIITGQLKAGQKLPNERDLAEEFQVTRGRVREALRALSLIGLVKIKPGEGTFIKDDDIALPSETIIWMFHQEINNLNEIYAARKLIETAVYLSAFHNATRGQWIKLEEILNELKTVEDETERPSDLIDEFDLHVGSICGNSIYTKLMQTIVHIRKETNNKIFQMPGAVAHSITLRSAIINAFKSNDEEEVKRTIEMFFEKSRQFYDSLLK